MKFFGLAVVAALAMGFGWAVTWWNGLESEASGVVLLLFGIATAAMLMFFLAGRLFRIRSHAYYMIAAGLVFLGVDLVLWRWFDIVPGTRFSEGNFVPAGVMGLFLGPLYRVMAIEDAAQATHR